jgi:hypothetical protein
MKRYGDDAAGYSVSFDKTYGSITVKAWGFWSAEIASTFGQNVAQACRAATSSVSLHLDMTDLKPMRDEGQHSFGTLMTALARLDVTSTTIVTGSHLTRLQLIRLAAKHGAAVKDTIRFIQREAREGSTA